MEGNTLEVMAAQIEKFHDVEVHTLADPRGGKGALVAVVPTGKKIEPLEAMLAVGRDKPVRRTGTAKIRDIASFVAHVNAFKDENSAIFVVDDPAEPRMLAIYDYNAKGPIGTTEPRFGAHRAEYLPQISDQWDAWTEMEAKPMLQGDFAAFIEDRIGDIVLVDGDHINEISELLDARVGGPSKLLALSRGLQVSVNSTVGNAVTLATGEVQIQFTETHTDAGAPITTPNLFFAGIPVFHGGEAYQVPIRIRYRLREGKIQWSYNIYRADKIFDDAFKGLRDTVTKECDVAVYAGEPEA
jgi:uncharacterized protein YfdQ (DUF2303 family)